MHSETPRSIRPTVAADLDGSRIEPKLIPFLKWPGGKRWLVARRPEIFVAPTGRYIEPFLGAGSVFFHLRPDRAVLGDLNSDVITAYRGIQEEHEQVRVLLEIHHQSHEKYGAEHYYKVRASSPRLLAARAARIIYLNRTCFNGIYRVNRRGQFNVPIGTKSNVILDTDDFEAVAQLLRTAVLRNEDFEPLIDEAKEGDLLFVDPPYTVRHNFNGFIKYNEKLFSWEDQERLAMAVTRAAARGVGIVATNASHESIRKLYKRKQFKIETVSRFSAISADIDSRKQLEELIITANLKAAKGAPHGAK